MTTTRWDHALSIAPLLADSLSQLERLGLEPWVPASTADEHHLSDAIQRVWRQIIEDAQAERFALSDRYVPQAYRLLASSAVAWHLAEFKNEGIHASVPWSQFLPEMMRTDMCEGHDESWLKYAIVLSELGTGGYVESLSLPLGWLCMSGLLLMDGQWAIYPPPTDHARLLTALNAAGSAHQDAEDLRAVLAAYAHQQRPQLPPGSDSGIN